MAIHYHRTIFIILLCCLSLFNICHAQTNIIPKSAVTAFTKYQSAAPHKAFAIGLDGAYGWRSGQKTIVKAEKEAIKICKQYSSAQCKLVAVDDEVLR